MNLDNRIPFFFGHREQHAVTQNSGIVDDDVKTTESVNCLINDALRSGIRTDVVGVGDSLSASGLDFVRYVLGGTRVATTSVTRCTEVVNHDEAAVCTQHEGVFATNSTSGTSDNADPTFNHVVFSWIVIRHVLTLGVQACVERSRISEKSAP